MQFPISRATPLAACLAILAFPFAALADDLMVHVRHNALDPAEITVAVGDTIMFHNLDEMPGGHSVVADDGSFESPALGKDEMWSRTFDAPGTFPYHIKQHPKARGKITVE